MVPLLNSHQIIQFEHGICFLPGRPTDTHSNKVTHKAESKQMEGRTLGKFKIKEVRVCCPQKILNSKKEYYMGFKRSHYNDKG